MYSERIFDAIGYQPHEGQLDYHLSTARFKINAAGRRWGKSLSAAAEWWPDLLNKDKIGKYWVVGPTYDTCDEFEYLWNQAIALGIHSKLKKKAFNTRTGEMYMQFPWGTLVQGKSGNHPDSLVGKGLRAVIVSEAAKQSGDIWTKYLRPALADYHGTAQFPSTPEGLNWYYKLHLRGLNKDPRWKDWESWNSPSWENNHVYPGGFDDPEIQSQLITPDDPWFWQEIGASFRSVVGLIYSEWNEDIHIKKHVFDPTLQNQLWFDFGFTAPFVCLDAQIDASDNVYIWREYYVAKRSDHEHAIVLSTRDNPDDYRIDAAFGDAAGPNAVDELSRILYPVVALGTAKDFMKGINLVKQWLRTKDGKAKLFVDPSCENTIREFANYRMKPAANRVFSEDPKELPLKKEDHCLDSIRYGMMHNFELGANEHLEDYLADFNAMPSGTFTLGGETMFSLDRSIA